MRRVPDIAVRLLGAEARNGATAGYRPTFGDFEVGVYPDE